MPVGFDEDSFLEYNPLKDAKDKVVELIDKIARELEGTPAGKASLAQLASRLNEIRASLPQLRANLDGLRRLQSALKDSDLNLSNLREDIANHHKHSKRALVQTTLEDITLELDDVLTSVLHERELQQLARVELEPDLANVAQIFIPHWSSRSPIWRLRGPRREGSRSLGTDSDETETGSSHRTFESSQIALERALRNVAHFTVDELCEKIRSTPELSSIPIGDLFRREMPTGFKHEFILIKSVPVVGPSVWIRIDRAAKGYERGQLRTTYPADDTARMVGDDNHSQMVGKSRLRAHVVFPHESVNEPSFLTLADLVTIMHDESQAYRLLSENCYFFTSVIQEILTEHYDGRLVSGALGHTKLGMDVRRRIRRRFAVDKPVIRSPDLDHHTSQSRSCRSRGIAHLFLSGLWRNKRKALDVH